jgi:hypothetical protein
VVIGDELGLRMTEVVAGDSAAPVAEPAVPAPAPAAAPVAAEA